jgi:hypothetical protein
MFWPQTHMLREISRNAIRLEENCEASFFTTTQSFFGATISQAKFASFQYGVLTIESRIIAFEAGVTYVPICPYTPELLQTAS